MERAVWCMGAAGCCSGEDAGEVNQGVWGGMGGGRQGVEIEPREEPGRATELH